MIGVRSGLSSDHDSLYDNTIAFIASKSKSSHLQIAAIKYYFQALSEPLVVLQDVQKMMTKNQSY